MPWSGSTFAEVQNMPTDLFRRHLGGSRGIAKRVRDDGSAQSMEEIMVSIHAWTEEWKAEQAGRSLAGLVRIGLATRASETQDLGLLGPEFEALDAAVCRAGNGDSGGGVDAPLRTCR